MKELTDHLAKITHAFGGTLVNHPFFAAFAEQEITVHPIGGACLSSDGTSDKGSLSHTGEVLTGSGRANHAGLVVVDGAAVPTALGVNPFATITALAERSVEAVADAAKIYIDLETENGVLDFAGKPARSAFASDKGLLDAEALVAQSCRSESGGIGFSEVMEGFIHIGPDIKDFQSATRFAKGANHSASFFLSVRSWNLDDLINGKEHEGMLTGTFSHGALHASPYVVLRGTFKLFNEDEKASDTKNLTYDFNMVGTDGSVLHFHGYKIVSPSIAGSAKATWLATSTLYVDITQPKGGSLVGRGTLNISASDFAQEMKTLEPAGGSILGRTRSIFRFLT